MTLSLDDIQPAYRERLELLLRRRWSPPGEHPLRRLQDQSLARYRLLALLGPRNNVGSRYFQLLLVDEQGRLADEALALGLFNSGPFPAYNWLELVRYSSLPTFDGATLDLRREELDVDLFRALSGLIPPGGHLMVEYDSPAQRSTERILTLAFPPAASPIGYLMFSAGCRSFRNWYISEGGREGPRKLQGFKPLNDEVRREKSERLSEELEEFLRRDTGQGTEAAWASLARDLARRVLDHLAREAA